MEPLIGDFTTMPPRRDGRRVFIFLYFFCGPFYGCSADKTRLDIVPAAMNHRRVFFSSSSSSSAVPGVGRIVFGDGHSFDVARRRGDFSRRHRVPTL